MRPERCFYCFPPFGSPAASFSNDDEQKSLALLNQYSEILSCERDQLKKRALLAQALPLPDVGVPVYKAGTEVKPCEIEKKGLEEAKKKKVVVGRLQVISIASVMKFDATSSGSSWFCKKNEEIRIQKAVCRIRINKTKSTWFWCKELGN
ncbi:uncharacterized protein LOC105799669 isoform X1 [Gossypium raimondii]|uniref:Uncharacterized protein n=1 Tax=Gossypium raimondii TaxID=29730 RepID=A0A0D2QAM2_GOSRA|nr:uncharacterized protein LOC105799669 isoform X1 [Gossypium raimondii]KJB36358.1 hypothetical protein B456_006G154700 [Gossypium raimondii]